jgi:KDO2-lipid IV(A) lauroyltransferase
MSRDQQIAPPAQAVEPPRQPRLARRLRVNVLFGCVRVLELLTRVVPRLGVPGVGGAIGRFAQAAVPGLRRLPLRHLEECLGEELNESQRRRIVREMYEHLGRAVFELMRLRQMSGEQVDRLVKVDGIQSLEAAAGSGKGFIIVTGHLGNWELMAAWVARRVPLTVLARRLPNWRLDEWLVETRRRHRVRTVYRGSFAAARDAIRALRRDEALGILIDQDTDVDGAFVPFFGRPAFTPTGAVALALRTGAPILPAVIRRDGPRLHRVVFEPPVIVKPLGSKQQSQQEYTALLTGRIEAWIRRCPEQWVWMHRRFKTPPPRVDRP